MMKVIDVQKVGLCDTIITVEHHPSCRRQRYRGDCTVWHDAETGKRQPTSIEAQLADVWQKWEWHQSDAKSGRI